VKLCRCGRVVKDRCLVCNPPRKHAGTTKDRGYSNDHRKASETYRTLHPLCECCVKKTGVLHANASEEMHHIEAIADNPMRRMDRGNWLAVCRPCHEELEGDTISGMVVKRWSEQFYEDSLNGTG
jgi:hypothetical protein